MSAAAFAAAAIWTLAGFAIGYWRGLRRGRILELADLESVATRMASQLTPQLLAEAKAEALERLASLFYEKREAPGGFEGAARVADHLASLFRAEVNTAADAIDTEELEIEIEIDAEDAPQ